MLGTKSKAKVESTMGNSTTVAADTCAVSTGTFVEGKFTSTENVRFDGTLKGEFSCTQRLVMGESAKIEGTVVVQDAIVMGTIDGQLLVKGNLHLKPTAFINGNIKAKTMTVEEGARYAGECKIGVEKGS